LLAPLRPGMERPPHAMRLGDDERDYYTREANYRPVPPADPGEAYDEKPDFFFHAPQGPEAGAPEPDGAS
jgi:hypothetical protein